MENFTSIKLPDDDEISEVPDFYILPPNLFENLLSLVKQQDAKTDIATRTKKQNQHGRI